MLGQTLTTAGDYLESPKYRPRYVICTPLDYPAALRYARLLKQDGGGDLIVRPENRLTAAVGVTNPLTGATTAGHDHAWLLAAPADTCSGLLIGAREGKLEPTIRSFDLGLGQWGMGFDAYLDIGATIESWRGLYLGLPS